MLQKSRVSGAEGHYTGALDGLEGKVNAAEFDPVVFSRQLYESAPLELTFRAQNRKQAEVWQKQLRAKLAELVGGFPAKRGALNAQTLEVREFPEYRREKFIFESRPGLAVLGYLLTPSNAKAPYRTMVCVPGHGLPARSQGGETRIGPLVVPARCRRRAAARPDHDRLARVRRDAHDRLDRDA